MKAITRIGAWSSSAQARPNGAWADGEVSLCRLTRERFDAFVAAMPGFEHRLHRRPRSRCRGPTSPI
jgi:CRP-like cAMP-binding protein